MRSTSTLLRAIGWGFGFVSAVRGDWWGVTIAAVFLLFDGYMQGLYERRRAEMDAWQAETQARLEDAMAQMTPEERAHFEEAIEVGYREFREVMDRRWWHRFTRR